MDDINFLEFLRKKYPYLYDIEMRVREVRVRRSGFGDITVNLLIKANQVATSDIGEFTKTSYNNT